MEKRFLVGGSGGQGILFMGKVMAYAALYEGKEVTWYPSYGAEMRCGTANCAVIISDEAIGSPAFAYTDYLIVFNEASLNRYLPRLKKEGILFYDSTLFHVNGKIEYACITLEATAMARELGSTRVANMVMLGAVAAATGILHRDQILTSLEADTSECTINTLPLNRAAIIKGYELIENKKSTDP